MSLCFSHESQLILCRGVISVDNLWKVPWMSCGCTFIMTSTFASHFATDNFVMLWRNYTVIICCSQVIQAMYSRNTSKYVWQVPGSPPGFCVFSRFHRFQTRVEIPLSSTPLWHKPSSVVPARASLTLSPCAGTLTARAPDECLWVWRQGDSVFMALS